MARILAGIALLLLAHTALKVFAIANAFRWAKGHAQAYCQEFRMSPPANPTDVLALLRKHEATFLPFGAKDLVLQPFWSAEGGGRAKRIARGSVYFWSRKLMENWNLTWVVAAFLVTAGAIPHAVGHVESGILLALAGALVVMRVAMAVESIFWYLTENMYSNAYLSAGKEYMANDSALSDSRRREELHDLWFALRRTTLGGAISLVVLCATAQLAFPGTFTNIRTGTGIGATGTRLLESVYYVATTILTVGYGDIRPDDSLGQGLAVVMMATGLLLFGVLLTFAIGRASGLTRQDP